MVNIKAVVDIETMPLREIIKNYVLGVGYLFMLTIIGVLVVTLYNYYYPISMSIQSVLTVTGLFTVVVITDVSLMFANKPTPTLIAIIFVISPILILYKLLKSTDLINIDRSTPRKLKNYVPPRIIGG